MEEKELIQDINKRLDKIEEDIREIKRMMAVKVEYEEEKPSNKMTRKAIAQILEEYNGDCDKIWELIDDGTGCQMIIDRAKELSKKEKNKL